MGEGRRLGGLRRRRELTVQGAYDIDGLDSVPKLRRLLETAAPDTLGLENSISRSRALAYIAVVGADLLKAGELEDRVAALEGLLRPRAPAPGAAR